MFKRLMDKAGDDGAGGSGGADAAAQAAAAAGGGTGSAIGAGAEKPEEWIPEKYQVKGADGKIDEGKSARAGMKALKELQARMVEVGLPPEDAEKYELEAPSGFDLAELKKDPLFASALKGYHAVGMTNKQVQQVINDMAKFIPEIAAAATEQNSDACIANLQLVWKTPEELSKNLSLAHRGASTLAKSLGLEFKDIEAFGLGNNPMFARLMVEYARQTGEDSAPNPGTSTPASGEWEDVKKRLDNELAAIPESDQRGRRKKLDELGAHYEKRYPKRGPVINQQQRTAAA